MHVSYRFAPAVVSEYIQESAISPMAISDLAFAFPTFGAKAVTPAVVVKVLR